MRPVTRFRDDETGAMSVLAVSLLLVVLLFSGVAVDGARGVREKASLRAVAESAAQAAVAAMMRAEDAAAAVARTVDGSFPENPPAVETRLTSTTANVELSKTGNNAPVTFLLGLAGIDRLPVRAAGRAKQEGVAVYGCAGRPSLRSLTGDRIRFGLCAKSGTTAWLGEPEKRLLNALVIEISGLHVTNPYDPGSDGIFGLGLVGARPESGFREPDTAAALLAVGNAADRSAPLEDFVQQGAPSGFLTRVTCVPGQVLRIPARTDLRGRGIVSDCPVSAPPDVKIGGTVIVSDLNALMGAGGVPSDRDALHPASCGAGAVTRVITDAGTATLGGLPAFANDDSPLRGVPAPEVPELIAQRADDLDLADVCPDPEAIWTRDRLRLERPE